MSKVVLIGAGPGDPELLTIKGKEYISKADLIVYDRLASKDILNLAKPECVLLFAGKENHHHYMKQDEINELLAESTLKYDLVVRLKGGDSYVFGRGGEEALFLRARDIQVEVVPGISSCIAALETAGIPITHRGVSRGFHVITAHGEKSGLSTIDFSQFLDTSITYVFLMGLSLLDEIVDGLVRAGRDRQTPIAVISNGTTPRQKKVVGTLSNIKERVTTSLVVSPAVIVVGDVVGLSDELDFLEKKSLYGKRYIVPYIRGFRFSYEKGVESIKENRLGRLLTEKGAEINSVEVGRIVPIDIEAERLLPEKTVCCETTQNKAAFIKPDADASQVWLVFTSVNGVHTFFYNLKKQNKDIRALWKYKIAVVGKKTQEALADFGIVADFIPSKANGRCLGEELCKLITNKTNIYIYSAIENDKDLSDMLEEKCRVIHIPVYKNESLLSECDDKDNAMPFDGIFFTCGSSAQRYMAGIGLLPPQVFSIGPKCSDILASLGVNDYIEANETTYEALVEAALSFST